MASKSVYYRSDSLSQGERSIEWHNLQESEVKKTREEKDLALKLMKTIVDMFPGDEERNEGIFKRCNVKDEEEGLSIQTRFDETYKVFEFMTDGKCLKLDVGKKHLEDYHEILKAVNECHTSWTRRRVTDDPMLILAQKLACFNSDEYDKAVKNLLVHALKNEVETS